MQHFQQEKHKPATKFFSQRKMRQMTLVGALPKTKTKMGEKWVKDKAL